MIDTSAAYRAGWRCAAAGVPLRVGWAAFCDGRQLDGVWSLPFWDGWHRYKRRRERTHGPR